MNQDIRKEIREEWFKDHKAKIHKCGDITILEWEEPNSITYYTRYIFDGNKMYITGDLGEAVFCLTWKANIDSFHGLNIGYFMEKMSAFSDDEYDFDSEQAVSRLKEWKIELLENIEFEDELEEEEFHENIDGLIESASGCSGKNEWAYEIVNGRYNDFISEEDCDYWEWIYDIGDVVNPRIYAYLIGLQMASGQLKDKEDK